MLNFKVDGDKCTGCGQCVAECPVRIISMPEGSQIPVVESESEDKCFGCEHCYMICPTGALSVFGLDPVHDSIGLSSDCLPAADQMENLVRARRSIRKYKQQNVSRDLINRLLAATANCPTAVNNTALRFDVISDIDKMNELRTGIMSELVSYRNAREFAPPFAYLENAIEPWQKHGADVIFRTAPHALIVSAPVDVPYCSIVDVSIALSYFELLAQANGLGTVWCGLMKMSLELLPQYKQQLLSPGAGDYYCMLFGEPDVKFYRTAKRDMVAKIRHI